MTMDEEQLRRIADALERLAPQPAPEADARDGSFFRWDGARLLNATAGQLLPLERFVGVDHQKAALERNFRALAHGDPAHDMLLWGSRGMGKSAMLRSFAQWVGIGMAQATVAELATLPHLFERLRAAERPFLLFVDDLAFTPDDPAIRTLRSMLDGGVSARPENVRLAVTSNHRHLLERPPTDSRDVRHARDVVDDQLALVDRFGLVLGFHAPDQETYVEMVRRHLAAEGLDFAPEEAIAFALERGGRSGRTAWHYRTEVVARHRAEMH